MKPSRTQTMLALVVAIAAATPLSGHAQLESHELRMRYPGLQVTSAQGPGQGSPAGPQLQLSTNLVDFGNVATHTTETRQVLVSNTSTRSLTFSAAPFVTGDAAFATNYTACGEILGAGSDCVTDVTFSPTAIGSVEGLLTFSTALVGSPHNVTLKGTAYNPVSLAAVALPKAMVGTAYSFDFKTLLSVSNESTPNKALATWEGGGTLPAGLSFNTTTGVLSGTPSAMTEGTAYTVTGTYKNNAGQQVYTVRVGDAVLEVLQIASGNSHSCAVLTSGAVKCWGANNSGQLGDGTTTQRLRPVVVSGLSMGIVRVTVGNGHSCALTAGGAVKCWGGNTNGQLGDNSKTTRLTPVDVQGLGSGVKSIGAAAEHSCAVTSSGAAKCWGYNGQNQLGNGNAIESWIPGNVSGLSSGVDSIGVGAQISCAVTTAGAVHCWGGYYGANAQAIKFAASGISSVAASGGHVCAVTSSGEGKCWGSNSYGQLGDGTTTSRWASAVDLTASIGTVKNIVLGSQHTCATTAYNGLKCWGRNDKGQLGDGTTTNRGTPGDVAGLTSGVSNVSAGVSHTCAMTTDNVAKCWGYNLSGQLGDGTTSQRLVPVNALP